MDPGAIVEWGDRKECVVDCSFLEAGSKQSLRSKCFLGIDISKRREEDAGGAVTP